tara:strand:- start:357 stop:872 length:516 start_codon:yes stop_codon:yes gene_type:complete
MTAEHNFRNICNIATDVMGLPKGSLADKSRKRHLQVTRAVAAYIGRKEEKVHRNIIAKVLNRDRTLIYHYEHSHKANYATFPFYRETFNKVYKAYINLEGEKDVFLLGSELKKYLLKNNVKETKNEDNEVLFEVVSGDASCLIKTTYFDFSNQFENIKLAMENYHFKINII